MTNAQTYIEILKGYQVSDEELLRNCERAWSTRNTCDQIELFAISVALFCFGRVEFAARILEFLPVQDPDEPYKNYRRFAWAIRDLLPIPPGLDPMKPSHHAPILEWLKAHEQRLEWNESTGTYTLRD